MIQTIATVGIPLYANLSTNVHCRKVFKIGRYIYLLYVCLLLSRFSKNKKVSYCGMFVTYPCYCIIVILCRIIS